MTSSSELRQLNILHLVSPVYSPCAKSGWSVRLPKVVFSFNFIPELTASIFSEILLTWAFHTLSLLHATLNRPWTNNRDVFKFSSSAIDFGSRKVVPRAIGPQRRYYGLYAPYTFFVFLRAN